METKHTKGEWIADVTESTFEQTIRTKEGIRIAEAKSFGNPFNDATLEERIANAKLIAAAPDLLDVVKYISREIERLGMEDVFDLKFINNAIKKATK